MMNPNRPSPDSPPPSPEPDQKPVSTAQSAAVTPELSGLSRCNCRNIAAPHSYLSHLLWGAEPFGESR